MVKYILSVVFSTWFVMAFAQTFNKFYPIDFHSPPYDYLPNGRPDRTFEVFNASGESEFLMFGDGVLESPSNTSFPSRIWSMRFSAEGDVLSNRRYDEYNNNMLLFNTFNNSGMIKDHKNNLVGIVVVRNSVSEPGQISELKHYLTRFDDEGNLLDSVLIQYPSDGIEFRSYVLREDPRDSTYIIIGGFRTQAQMATNTGLTGMIAKIDTLGNLLWWNDVPNTSYGNDVIMAPNGQYVATYVDVIFNSCMVNNFADNARIVLCTFNPTLIEKDRIVYDNYCSNEWANLAPYDDNTVIVGGVRTAPGIPVDINSWGSEIFTQKIEINEIGWMVEESEVVVHDMDTGMWSSDFKKITCDEGYIMGGNWQNNPESRSEGFLIKFSNELQEEWRRGYWYFDLTMNQPVYRIIDVTELSDCGFLLTGYIENTSASLINNQVTPWLVRTDEYGCLEPGCQLVGAEELAVGLDGTVKLYPNPANEWMQLEFTFPEHLHSQFSSEDFRLNVYSVDGKLMLEEMIPREQIIQQGRKEINTTTWPEGTYLIHLSQGNVWIDSVQGVVLR